MLLFCSCGQKSNKQTLLLDYFTLTGYNWTFKDSTRSEYALYLGEHVDINKNGDCKIMRHEVFKDSARYFQTTINDTLAVMLNDLFLNKKYKDEYNRPPDDSTIFNYCGFSYLITYSSPKTGHHSIDFIEHDWTPSQILNLKKYIDSNFIYNPNHSLSKVFDLATITDTVKKHSPQTILLPKLPIEKIKFTPPTDSLIVE